MVPMIVSLLHANEGRAQGEVLADIWFVQLSPPSRVFNDDMMMMMMMMMVRMIMGETMSIGPRRPVLYRLTANSIETADAFAETMVPIVIDAFMDGTFDHKVGD